MRKLFHLFILFHSLAVCQTNQLFIKDIPHYKSGKLSIFYSLIREHENSFHLDTIENGYDSLQIRIWYHYPKFYSPKNVFILKRYNSKWETLLYSYDSTNLKRITAKSNIQQVVKKLFDHKILVLPNMNDIKGLDDNYKDGESYTVEISTKQHYRLYRYHVLKEFNRFSEVKSFMKILKLLEKEFGIPLAHWEK